MLLLSLLASAPVEPALLWLWLLLLSFESFDCCCSVSSAGLSDADVSAPIADEADNSFEPVECVFFFLSSDPNVGMRCLRRVFFPDCDESEKKRTQEKEKR